MQYISLAWGMDAPALVHVHPGYTILTILIYVSYSLTETNYVFLLCIFGWL